MKTSNRILLIIIAAIFIGIIIAAIVVRVNTSIVGTGEIITKAYKLPDFDAIHVSGENRITIKLTNKSLFFNAAGKQLKNHELVGEMDTDSFCKYLVIP
jgi:hypothetical protein